MSENLLYLLPGLSLQFAFAAGLLWLFIRPSDDVPVTHILLIALGFCILNLGIEWVLRDYLLEATLVAQWTFFVLLATHFLSIPLPRAALTMFCFFAFMLGAGMIGSKLAPPELSEEERLLIEGFQAVETPESIESKELSQWVVRVRNGILDKRLVSARSVTLRALYPAPETAEKTEPETDTETDMAVAEKPEPTPAPPKNPDPDTAQLSQTPAMSGKEFESLFSPAPPVKSTGADENPPQSIATPDRRADHQEEPESVDEIRPDRRDHPGGFNAEQLSDAVEVRNRSTDRRYPHPQFEIGAVSMGENGRFAIVDGEMLKEGSIVRTNEENPRGWKLHRIGRTELFWQPLK